jgi:hypothetical protein
MLASQWMNFIHLCVMSFGGVELELWLSFNYITTNVALARVMSLKKAMELSFLIIIQLYYNQWNIQCVTWHLWSTIKLNYLTCAKCMVSKTWNYWFIENVSIWYCATWTLMLHTCMTHDTLLFVDHPRYVKSSQSKDINLR